ncbi:MAG: GNAT family N-acetyltransferase [Chloroflexota bacterium]
MTSNIWIRPASRDDSSDIAMLLGQLGYPTDPVAVMTRLGRVEATGLDQILVAEEQEQIVGVAALHIIPALIHQQGPLAQITAIVVDEQRLREGIGRQLLETAEELARNAGCYGIEISSNAQRTAVHTFYETLGYTQSSFLFRKVLHR